MNNWGANHATICYGHIGVDLITLASILRIPIAMHNLPEKEIFQPIAWGMFGAMDPQLRLSGLRRVQAIVWE